jgi:hypothetical protein
MSVDAKKLRQDRIDLAKVMEQLSLPIQIRDHEAYSEMDTSAFYAKSATRELIVQVVPDVTWGPDLCAYCQDADEFRPLECLTIDVPNTLRGRVNDIADAVRAWFDQR